MAAAQNLVGLIQKLRLRMTAAKLVDRPPWLLDRFGRPGVGLGDAEHGLDHPVGVGDGGRLRRADDEHTLGCGGEPDHEEVVQGAMGRLWDVVDEARADAEAEADADNAGFFNRIVEGRPLVTLKLASSFDGRIATGTGESQWITGPPARRADHAMRMRHDAGMGGGGTARVDDPSLTVRDLGAVQQPTRVVISRRLDLPLMGALARTAQEIPVLLCHGSDADKTLKQTWSDLGATLIECKVTGSQLDPRDILTQLGTHGLTRVFCEGGSTLAASLIEAQLVDHRVGFTAGVTIGAEGLPNIGALGIGKLREAARFELRDVRQVGGDVLHHWVARGS